MRAQKLQALLGIVIFFIGSGLFLPPVLMLVPDRTLAVSLFAGGLLVAGLGFWLFYRNRDAW